MPSVGDLVAFLDAYAPAPLAEPWDNVGLLLGDRAADVTAVMTCLTLTPDVAAEAIRQGAGLVATHHPILFQAVKRLTSDTHEGAMLLALTRAGIAVHSPHTSFDGANDGINARIAKRLGLLDVSPLRPITTRLGGLTPTPEPPAGAGRHGTLPRSVPFTEFAQLLKDAFGLPSIDAVPSAGNVSRVGVACGSAAEFLADAVGAGCEVLVTGEARFHAAVDARTRGMGLVLLGHYASERFAIEGLADVLGRRFSDLKVWASRDERDPWQRL